MHSTLDLEKRQNIPQAIFKRSKASDSLPTFLHSISNIEDITVMADKDDNVYMAKLAEQAERYDGKNLK